MQAAGTWLLLAGARMPVRAVRWFFLVQPAVFPVGLTLSYFPPLLLLGGFTTSMLAGRFRAGS